MIETQMAIVSILKPNLVIVLFTILIRSFGS